MGYVAQYNKCGLRCEDSEDIASERSENLHFRPPHSHLTPPLQQTPANRIRTIPNKAPNTQYPIILAYPNANTQCQYQYWCVMKH